MPAPFAALVAALLSATSITWTTANSTSAGDQDDPAVACNRTGRTAVVWEDDRDTTDPADDSHSDIYLRSFQDGIPVFETKLSAGGTAGTDWKHINPDVGLDDNGNAVVVWAEDPDGNGYFNIAYRVVNPAGTVLASGTANANATGNQITPKVAVDPDGTPANPSAVAFTVVWEDIQTTSDTVRAAGYTSGTTKAYEVAASQTTGTHHRPDVGVSASGDATVVWEQDSDANGYAEIGLVRLAKANGAVTLTRRTANFFGTGQQLRPAIAENFDGDFVVAWQSDHTGTSGIWTRSFTDTGVARTDEVLTSADPLAAGPTVGLDDQSAVVVGWTTGGVDGWLRGLNPDGTATGRLPAQELTETTIGRQDQFAVAVSPYSEVAICYTDDSDGNGFDQVILGTGSIGDEDPA
jgi:hypothetical protein